MINAANVPMFCDRLNFSAGRERSFNPAATRPHFINGAQKNTVFGPGVFTNERPTKGNGRDADLRDDS
jgi:hypothetical protein